MVHDLQQDVVDVRMRLLDLVEEHHAVGVRAYGVDEQAALFEADVSRRRADQPRHRVLLHVLAHVEADELVAEQDGELSRQLRLADARGAREQERPGRMIRQSEARARTLDGLRHEVHGLLLAEHHALERLLERAQPLTIGRRRLTRWNSRHAGDDGLDVWRIDDGDGSPLDVARAA